jgi:hypothetical protein
VPIRSVTLRILGESKDALAKMKAVNAEADKLDKRRVMVNVGVDLDMASVTKVKAGLTALSKFKTDIPLTFKIDGLTEALAKIKTELAAIRSFVKSNPVELNIGASGGMDAMLRNLHNNFDMISHDLVVLRQQTDQTNAHLATLAGGFRSVRAGLTDTARTVETTGNQVGKMFTGGRGWGWLSFFTGKVALFGGLATIGGLHLLADAILEVLAVWIPATVAAVAFGVAASDAVKSVFTHMQNLHIVMDATNRVIPPMTGNMEKLHQAVRPAVYQVFGDALTIMNEKTGLFKTLALGTSQVVEHLAARMTVAITSGNGMSEFMKNAVPDVAKLGDAFGNLFGIIGNILHVMPGYAQILLTFGDGLLHILEIATKVAEPFIGLGLAVHGFIVWAGLGATVALALGKAIIFLGDTALGGAIKTFGVFVADLITITLTEGIATAATFAFTGAMAALSAVNPLVWVGAAIAGLIALVLWFRNSSSAASRWGDALQKNIDSAATVSQGLVLTQQAALASASRLALSNIKLAGTQKMVTDVNLHTGIATKVVSQAYSAQAAVVEQNRAQWQRFNQEVEFNRGRMTGLEKVYGTQTQVMGLLNAAGVTQSEWQDKSAEGWAIITQKVNGTIAGYKAMGQTGGTLNNDLNVLDRNITDQYKAMQNLNQGWDQFITDLTGTQNSFDTVALGLKTLASNAAHTTASVGRTHITIVGLGTAMDGLSKQDLALNQAFQSQISSTNAMFDSWRQAGIAANIFNSGVKAGIAPLLKYAQGSKSATFELVGLAQEAGFKGVPTLQNLTKWVGNTSGALAKMKAASNQATIQEALLTGSMKAQGQYLSTSLLRDSDQAVLRYKGVSTAANNYAKAIANDGIQSSQAHAARDQLVKDIFNAERQMGASKSAAEKLTAAMVKIPTNIVSNIIEHGVGNFSITGPSGFRAQGPGGHGGPLAKGGMITGGIPGKDSVLGLLKPGEVVVPTEMVNAGAVDHLRGKLPRFAAGGFVERGDLNVLTGAAAVNFDKIFKQDFTSAMENSMTAAMKQAISSAKKAFFSFGGGGGGGTGEQIARRMFPWPASMWPAFNYVEMREAGYNLHAQNPSSGAYGVAQFINGPSEYYQWGGNPNTFAGQFAGMFNYIRSRYRNPDNAAAHERAFNWYGRGTMGAKPGWAWTGEFGPELVKMKGGETVLDHGSSLANSHLAAGGYGSGAGFEPFAHSRAIAPRGTGNVYITVNGDSDPDGAALRIIQKLQKYKGRHGNVNLGFD